MTTLDPARPWPCETIDEVIARLDEIILIAKQEKSRLGYFPALYRKVTVAVRDGIHNGIFEDGARMELLDVRFANRYFAAYEQHRRQEPPTQVWRLAFDAAGRWRYAVIQHLLVGMSAHINLDLGIAATESTTPAEIKALKKDFNAINDMLASMIDDVQRELAQVWPLFRVIDLLTGKLDEYIAGLGIKAARDQAWGLAERLTGQPDASRPAMIDAHDRSVTRVSSIILQPGPLFSTLLFMVRLGEMRNVRRIIEILE